MKRSDIHRPSAPEFDPEAYEFFGCFDLNPDPMWGADDIRARRETVSALVKQGWKFTSVHGSGQCGHCGARIRYAALMGHTATKGLIYVGETCLDNRFSLTKGEFARLRKEASLNAERSAKRVQIEKLLAAAPHLVWASYANNIAAAGATPVYYTATSWGEEEYETPEEAAAHLDTRPGVQDWVVTGHKRGTSWSEQTHTGDKVNTLSDIWNKFQRYGDLSDKQINLVERLVEWLTEAEVRRAAREAEREAVVSSGVQVPTGRVVVEGKVLSVKSQESQYGTTWKMLVQHEDGWKVWGSIPASLRDEVSYYSDLKGQRVRFTAAVEASNDDQLFGFFKRPTKAQIVEA